ncbi:CoA ester lyase [Rhizobium oryzihabitans]|uniref:CoA ester lyase n=1 Tax=Rhizobium oryzihabitans TaxID=2267833 RepID=A0A7L5BIC6_9HYPH|nr:CoA ester lyase [Rhizobium oryzihabitans]QIB38602.1 CoA ester lyase [Rhizobium oryzihabitans]CUX35326.1 putative citrate lyase beta chain (Citrase beta chain) (Citrate (pro-3S)-lyase beta chain) (Citryl-CoA lyase subunit) (citE) [Agrobacterium genomosp. 5 str. CFBP 6626]
MTNFFENIPVRPRRSLLSVPAINVRALEKIRDLDCDGVILDLEDSVAPDMKGEARENLGRLFSDAPFAGRETIIRINPLSTPDGMADLKLVLSCRPDAVLLPKVEQPADIHDVADLLAEADAPQDLKIWAMIETPLGVLNAASIADAAHTPDARLAAFVIGLNDLRKETRVPVLPGRTYLVPWMMQVVLAARAYGLDVIDSVSNDFRDIAAFDSECEQGRAMGFDGKMLIHPAQIEPANRRFAPDDAAVADAREIIAAFAKPESMELNVINMNGRMIERLHVGQAERLVAMADIIAQRKAKKT